jgi:predicted LPLAT superfamily acyltransferase
LYFVVTAVRARRASKKYLARLRSRPATLADTIRHFHCFASVILDRVFLLTGRDELFDIQLTGLEIPLQATRSGRGALLFGTHLGSFEILRALAVAREDVRVKVLMYRNHNQAITELLEAINPEVAATVIDLARPDAMLLAKECIDQGYLVAMLADRVVEDANSVICDFLGHPARLPTGGFRLAALMQVPVVLFFGIYRGSNRYDIYFELLRERITLRRRGPSTELGQVAQAYMQRIEHYVRIAPYNWFNFYDYWDD